MTASAYVLKYDGEDHSFRVISYEHGIIPKPGKQYVVIDADEIFRVLKSHNPKEISELEAKVHKLLTIVRNPQVLN